MTADQSGRSDDGTGRRDVVVPLRVYKAVTVFSTLFAVLTIVGGFILVDTATKRASVPASEVDVPVTIAGIALILTGTVVYAFSTRFRTEEMGKSKDDADKPSDNG